MIDRRRVASGSPYESWIGFSRALRVGDRVLVSGTGPVGSDAPAAGDQARRCFEIILRALADTGASALHVVRTRMYVTDPADIEEVGHAHHEVFAEVRPTTTIVVVAGLADPSWKVEIEAEAVLS